MEIIPVIHVVTYEQVIINIGTILRCGLKKVFLIGHLGNNDEVISLATEVKKLYPGLWVGVNLLGYTTVEMLGDWDFDGIWCDGAIDSELAKDRKFKGQFFGSLAFKYQKQPDDLNTAAEDAMKYCDVITTSGNATGKAASFGKIAVIRGMIGENHLLAIASGVNSENIKEFSEYVNYVLVASSITDYNELIIEDKLKELIDSV